jgi:hypothetical protein
MLPEHCHLASVKQFVRSHALIEAGHLACSEVCGAAAADIAPFHPKLSAVAVVNGDDFGARLDRAIKMSREGPQPLIELRANCDE